MRKMRCISNLKIKELIQSYTSRMEWKEYIEELYKKDPDKPDDYDGMVSHPEPDTLESEVKWTLGSTTVNKASRCDRIPVGLFKTLKDNPIKVFVAFNMSVNLEDPAVAAGLEKINPHPNPQEG